MRKTSAFLFCFLFIMACTHNKVTQEAAFPTTSQVENIEQMVSIANPVEKEIVTTGVVVDNPIKKTETKISTSKSESIPLAKQEEKAIEVVSTTQTPKELIALARSKQMLTQFPKDKTSFKKEEQIDLKDRVLNPLAYANNPITLETNAPWDKEQLKYGLYYSFVKVGTAFIKNRGIVQIGDKLAYLIQTTAFSASVIDTVFKVRDINLSWLDVFSFHSLGYTQSVREGNYKRDEWLIFDYENNKYYGEVKKKEEPKIVAGELNASVLDMLTSLYYVRTQVLEKGKDVSFDIINREKQYPLIVKVLGKETVKTSAGKFDCIVVEPQFRGEGIFVSKGKSLKVWLTDDAYKMPVKMQVEVFIGSVSAELLEYKRD